MYKIYNLTANPNVRVTGQAGPFTIITHLFNLPGQQENKTNAYYAGLMKFQRKQLICSLSEGDVIIRSGSMQWMAGDVRLTSGVKSLTDYVSRKISARLASQTPVHPVCRGTGLLVLEPTTKNFLIVSLDDWNGSIVLGACTFAAMETSVSFATVVRDSVSAALLGEDGLFSWCLEGTGYAVLEVTPPREELVEVILEDDILRIDGNFAIAWSHSLRYTVEKAASTLIGSALSEEGLVHVFKGTGKVLLAPLLGSVASAGT